MSALDNPRWEAFAQAIVIGIANGHDKPYSQGRAYQAAGYYAKGMSAEVNASRLLKKAKPIFDRTRRAQDRESVSQALERIRQVARQRKKEQFTSLFHHISVELLRVAFFALKRDAAPGVDGLTWQDYEADLDRKIEDLHARVHRGAYRALPSRRHYIPKADGQQRPLAIAALEDKIVQKAALILHRTTVSLRRCRALG
jgi:hypothetical protein